MSEMLFRADAYLTRAPGRITGHTDQGGVVLDRSLFYPTGGGQPADCGVLQWDEREMPVTGAVKGAGDDIVLLPGADSELPPVGTEVVQLLDWARRFGHMRVHTALHLLSVAVPLPVSGGSISAQRGRLDFDMPDAAVDKDALAAEINALIARDLEIHESWITDAELAANPEMVKTMSVRPPGGQGRVRLIGIGRGADQVDLQPCGGTHVARTGEIGPVTIGKTQKKGRQNRRIYLHIVP